MRAARHALRTAASPPIGGSGPGSHRPKLVGMERSDSPIALTHEECAAVLEVGLGPTYSIEPGVDHQGDAGNATLLASAARITRAGHAGVLPPELHAEVAELLREAIHDTRHDLWRERRGRDRWRAGDQAYALSGVQDEDHERRYAEQIDLCARLSGAFTSLALKLNAW